MVGSTGSRFDCAVRWSATICPGRIRPTSLQTLMHVRGVGPTSALYVCILGQELVSPWARKVGGGELVGHALVRRVEPALAAGDLCQERAASMCCMSNMKRP
eukprot:3358630-Amphidinium_carterae.2